LKEVITNSLEVFSTILSGAEKEKNEIPQLLILKVP
jgi:hypothetical protein